MKLITVVLTIFKFLIGLVSFYSALILKERGFTGVEIGLLLFIYNFIPLIISFPCGILNDRLNSRTLMAAGFLGNAVYLLGFSRINSFFILFGLFMVGGISNNLATISIQSLALKIVGTDNRAGKLGIYTAGSSIGFGLGMLAGGLLMDVISDRTLLFINGIAYFMLAALTVVLKKNTSVRLDMFKYIHEFKNRDVFMFCLIYSLFAFHWGSETSSYCLFLKEYFNLTLLQIGFFMFLPITVLGFSAFYTGKLLDKNMSLLIRLTYFSFLVSGAGQMLTVIPNVYVSFAMRLIHETGDGIAALLVLEGMASRFNVEKIGGLSSLITVSTILAQSLGSFLFSYIGATYGYHVSMVLGGMSAMSPVLVFYYYLNFQNKRAYPVAAPGSI